MKDKPLVLVSQQEHEELIHQVAGPGGAAVGVGFLTGRSAYWGPRRQENIGGVSHAEQLGNRSSCSNILRVHRALLRLYVQAKLASAVDQGAESLHSGAGGALQEVAISIGEVACQLHCDHLLQGVLEGQGKEQGPKRVTLENPRLGGHHGIV
jgi:hypothetical protein